MKMNEVHIFISKYIDTYEINKYVNKRKNKYVIKHTSINKINEGKT